MVIISGLMRGHHSGTHHVSLFVSSVTLNESSPPITGRVILSPPVLFNCLHVKHIIPSRWPRGCSSHCRLSAGLIGNPSKPSAKHVIKATDLQI